MASLDREIDQLYQLPTSEFTSARDELAKRDESNRATIKKLAKPNLPAWAVNQLYWQERGTYEALVAAAAKLRTAQMGSLTGKSVDVPKAEAAHATARKTALERIKKVLDQSGEAASPTTLTAITETLEALPTADSPGRLTRPLKPMGFEGLAGLLKSGGKIKVKRPAAVLPFKPPEKKPDARAAEREAAGKRKEAEKLASQVRAAKQAERAAETKIVQLRRELETAERKHAEIAEKLETHATEVERIKKEIDRAERQAISASVERQRLDDGR